MTRVLLVAATSGELAGLSERPGVQALVCGIGPIEAAVTVAAHLARGWPDNRPEAVVHLGIAGARDTSSLAIGEVVIGEAALWRLGVGNEGLMRRIDPDPALLDLARRVLPRAPVVPIETVVGVGGGLLTDVEAMEGAAVLSAAAALSVPAIELRAISNRVEESDRALWRIAEAVAAVQAAATAVVDAFLDEDP